MTIASKSDVYFDPYDLDIYADPYPTYKRLRDEAPIYYNEKHDFWALSRYEDVEKALLNWQTFSSARGDILEVIKANIQTPPGVILWEDPPEHTMHRALMSRVFTPRRMAELEDQVREFCARSLDPHVGGPGFDIMEELGTVMPMRVIGMLLGIPEADQVAIREHTDDRLGGDGGEVGKPMDVEREDLVSGSMFAEYVEWRSEHPSDDLMTSLLNAEFEDETGTVRKLTRQEVLSYTDVVAGAGNETTGRLIGWLALLLAEHADQRRELAEDHTLVPKAIDETLRYEPTGPHTARYITHDVEYYGVAVPAGSAALLINAAASRDERRYPDPDTFDIHREDIQHLTFGYGLHYCLGANLARLEGRIALEEMLKRFPVWEIDTDNAKMGWTSSVRGWEKVPILLP